MYEVINNVAVISLDNAPVNSLSHALRSAIVECLDQAQANRNVEGIVLTGCERAFSAGADVSEFGTPQQFQEPILRTVLERIEKSGKPVVAAMSGIALGGGLELALACHGRVALSNIDVGFPEINLGLIPGSSGTQRFPRLVGGAIAAEMILSGKPRKAKSLAGTRLFDSIVDEDVGGEGVRKAKELARKSGNNLPRVCDIQVEADELASAVREAGAKLNARQLLQPAYAAALKAMSAAALPFEAGLKKERELFLELMPSTAAKALRYQFAAERAATKVPPQLKATPRKIERIAVIGAGTMGTGIAIAALDAGVRVTLLEQDEMALARGHQRIRDHYGERVRQKKLDTDAAASQMGRLIVTTVWALLGDVDLVIEAVFEDLGVKQKVFRKISKYAPHGAILATNTSYLDIDKIADAADRPSNVLGLHFFSPANVMKLLEVVQGKKTSAEVLATGMSFGKALKKIAIPTGNAFGFIGNRIYNAYRRQCEFMLEDGAWPEDIDAALTGFGFAMGPFAVADLSGLDIAWRMRKVQAADRDPRERYVDVLDRLCEIGRYGRKAGAGYYAYVDGKQSSATDEVVRDLVEDASRRRNITRRTFAPAEIQRRVLLAMANEAAHLLKEGIASRAEDVDVALVQGYGFPRWEGGPVFWARQQQRSTLEFDLGELARSIGYGFVVADLSPLFSR